MNRRQFVLACRRRAARVAIEPRGARGAPRWRARRVRHRRSREPRRRARPRSRGGSSGASRPGPGPRSIESVHDRSAVVAHTEHGVVTLLDAATSRVRFELDGFARAAVHGRASALAARVRDRLRARGGRRSRRRNGRVLWRELVSPVLRGTSRSSPDGRTLWTALGTKAARVAVLDTSDPRRPTLVRTISPPVPRPRRRLRPRRTSRLGDVRRRAAASRSTGTIARSQRDRRRSSPRSTSRSRARRLRRERRRRHRSPPPARRDARPRGARPRRLLQRDVRLEPRADALARRGNGQRPRRATARVSPSCARRPCSPRRLHRLRPLRRSP